MIDLEKLWKAMPRDVQWKISCHDLKRTVDNYNAPEGWVDPAPGHPEIPLDYKTPAYVPPRYVHGVCGTNPCTCEKASIKECEAAYVAAYNEWLKQPMTTGPESVVYRRYKRALHDYAEAIERERGPLPELHIAADPNLSPEKHEALVRMFGILASQCKDCTDLEHCGSEFCTDPRHQSPENAEPIRSDGSATSPEGKPS